MTPLRQQRAIRNMAKLHFQALFPRLTPKPKPVMVHIPARRSSASEAECKRDIERICAALDLPVEKVLSDSRKQTYVWARYIIAHHLNKMLKWTLESTGRLMGGRGHATVLGSVRQYENLYSTRDEDFIKMVYRVKKHGI